MDWIKVEDRLPEENQIVFALLDYGGIQILEYAYINDGDNSGWAWCTVYDAPDYSKESNKWYGEGHFDDELKVVKWMPLPEPPKD